MLSVTMLPGKCSLTMVSRDSSGEVLSEPSDFLTRPSLLEGFDFRISDNFAIAGSVSTSLTNSWNLVLLASFMQFLSDLFRALRSFKSTGEGRPRRYAFLYMDCYRFLASSQYLFHQSLLFHLARLKWTYLFKGRVNNGIPLTGGFLND
jgi:hypothetical protein